MAGPGDLPEGYKSLFESITTRFDDQKFSDLTVTCGTDSWPVHKFIVCSRSDWLEKACDGRFKESDGIISLPDDDANVVRQMLKYLYTADYEDDTSFFPGDTPEPVPALLFNVLMHTLADKIKIPALCKLAEAKFAERATTGWNTAGFADAIEEMYDTAPDTKRAMQDTALEVAADHATDLYSNEYGERFKEVAAAVASFTSELFGRMMHGKGSVRLKAGHKLWECPNGHGTVVAEQRLDFQCCYYCHSCSSYYSGSQWSEVTS